MIARVGSFSQTSAMLAATMRLQVKLADVQAQEASGLKAQSFGALGRDTAKSLDVSARITRLTTDSANAASASSDLQSAYSALSGVADLAASLRSTLAASESVDADSRAASMQDFMNDLASLLNTSSAGRYLFSGQSDDTAAVDLDAYTASGEGDESYYQGSDTSRTFTSSTGRRIDLGVQANDPAFEKLFRAMAMVAASPDSATAASTAYDLVGEAVNDIGSLQEVVSSRTQALEDLQSRNDATINVLETLSSDLTGADLTQAAVLVVNYQTQLEALYSTLSQLSSMSLTKYL